MTSVIHTTWDQQTDSAGVIFGQVAAVTTRNVCIERVAPTEFSETSAPGAAHKRPWFTRSQVVKPGAEDL